MRSKIRRLIGKNPLAKATMGLFLTIGLAAAATASTANANGVQLWVQQTYGAHACEEVAGVAYNIWTSGTLNIQMSEHNCRSTADIGYQIPSLQIQVGHWDRILGTYLTTTKRTTALWPNNHAEINWTMYCDQSAFHNKYTITYMQRILVNGGWQNILVRTAQITCGA